MKKLQVFKLPRLASHINYASRILQSDRNQPRKLKTFFQSNRNLLSSLWKSNFYGLEEKWRAQLDCSSYAYNQEILKCDFHCCVTDTSTIYRTGHFNCSPSRTVWTQAPLFEQFCFSIMLSDLANMQLGCCQNADPKNASWQSLKLQGNNSGRKVGQV